MIDPAIESHYGTGYERSRLFPGGNPSLEFVRSMELLDRLLPGPPARLLDVGGGPGTYAAPLARRGYRVHLVDPVPLHGVSSRTAAAREAARLGIGTPAEALPRLTWAIPPSQAFLPINQGAWPAYGLATYPTTGGRG